MPKNIIRAIAFALILSYSKSFSAGLEAASVSGYSAFTFAVVSLVISDENGYMGVLLTKKNDPNDKIWLWNKTDSRSTADGYKGMLSIALSAMAQGSLVNAIVITAPQTYSFMDSNVKGNRIATNRITSLWVESL
jgi:hypothetical protein